MRIFLPIGIICFFGFFVLFVVIQSLIVMSDTADENNVSINGSVPGPGVVTQCLEIAKTMPLPILRCSHEECIALHGLFQCQAIRLNNQLIPSSEEILCRNLTSVLSCDLKSGLTSDNKNSELQLYNTEQRSLDCHNMEDEKFNEIYSTSYSKSNICFSSRGLYYCVHNSTCQRIPEPSALCTCQLVPNSEVSND